MQEYHVTYYTKEQVIRESVFLSEREEMFESETATAIYDYETVSAKLTNQEHT